MIRPILTTVLCLILGAQCVPASLAAENYPIIFTTQIPIPADFATIGSTFGNHRPDLQSVGRGGDLWIRYMDGSLKNLTQAAGYGNEGFQGMGSIAVRDPSVHWDGHKVIFSMALNAPSKQYEVKTYYWQLYEITGLAKNETPIISKVLRQPAHYNNISPIYGKDDHILFTSDRPRKGQAHHYPQLDEYESTPTVTGLWNLNPHTGHLFMVTHSPSGDFTPIIDSYGRVIFTRWDHLQRDQQADSDALNEGDWATFNWSNESVSAIALNNRTEVFPEPRSERSDLLAGTQLIGHRFNHFFPWMVNENGSELETLNHIGRHELHSYFDKSMTGDQNLEEFIDETSGRTNKNSINNFFQIQEDPLRPGYYIGIDAPEFSSHASGQIIELQMPPGLNPDLAQIRYRTPRITERITENPDITHAGHYRDPLPLSSGAMIAAHTSTTGNAVNLGSRATPRAKYTFRLKYLNESKGYLIPARSLTQGIRKTISYWDPDVRVTYSGQLWELHPVELRPRKRPSHSKTILAVPEMTAFAEAGVNLVQFKAWLKANDLALLVSRNVTIRDRADKQQPFNLKIAGSPTQTIGEKGQVYDISALQFFQGDLIRGIGGGNSPEPGRRVLAQVMQDGIKQNTPNPGGPAGSVKLGADGSMAALVPARRALSWQLTNSQGKGIVRERNWLSFSPGEVRVCGSCHGVNTADQSGAAAPKNKPQALVALLKHWSEKNSVNNADSIPGLLSVSQIDHRWKPIQTNLKNSVIITAPPSFKGNQPGVIRIREPAVGLPELRFQEWSYLDGSHALETVPLLQIEKGRHTLPDGSIWEVGTLNLGGTKQWKTHSFLQKFTQGTPRLLLTAQTTNGSQPVNARARKVTKTGFEVALFEEEQFMDGHAVETVAYLAIYNPYDSGIIKLGTETLPYTLQRQTISHQWLPTLDVALKLEEEQSVDPEIFHIDEEIDLLSLGRFVFAQDVSSRGQDPVAVRQKPAVGIQPRK